jgi:hypothetical protein
MVVNPSAEGRLNRFQGQPFNGFQASYGANWINIYILLLETRNSRLETHSVGINYKEIF